MAYFQYQPQWQGPLPGRSFEKQTEDAINGLRGRHQRPLGALDEVSGGQVHVATATQNGLMSKEDKVFLDGLRTSFPTLSNTVDALADRVQLAEGTIVTLSNSLNSLASRVTALENDTSLAARGTALENAFAELSRTVVYRSELPEEE